MSIALPAPGLAHTFALVIAGLCRTTASRIVIDRDAGPLLVRIFTRLHRLAARLTSLVTQLQAGTPPPSRPRRPAAGAGLRVPRQARLPESSGWLLRLVPGTAEYAGQVQALLNDSQTVALLEAAPQAGRILRPLCRMLALPLPNHLRPPKLRSAPSPAGAEAPDPPAEPVAAASRAWPPPSCEAAGASRQEAPATGLPPHPD